MLRGWWNQRIVPEANSDSGSKVEHVTITIRASSDLVDSSDKGAWGPRGLEGLRSKIE
ncbi:unnamed protein product [Toxocara canis]|uniref:Uncharacterized protein n=1 Tax=Toxocara canis TaxID=6265 RepID=A0A183U9J6_TOXCA|nr:unnamed protein product [Toxocara canis]